MTHTIKTIVKNLVRIAVLWVVDALSLAAAAWLLPGLTFQSDDGTPIWVLTISAALLLALINFLIRPLVLLIARPLGWIATLVIGFLVNAVALWATAWLLPGFNVTFWGGLFGGIGIAFFNTILTGILDVDEEGSWYQNRIERLAAEAPFDSASEPGRGLMMVEIDGLSYWHVKKALADGLMPTLQAMIDEDGFELSHVDCGLPSMTSACQAGIMFGDNFDIPAYRWYDKSKQKLYVSAGDATELNARYGHGQGLMRHGSSIMNMFNGDAEKSMFTMANMFEADKSEKKRRAEDAALLMLDPYFLTRAIALFLAEVVRELWQGWQQKRHDVQPRLNRLAHGYPFLRAAMCVLMRDISTNIAILDMMRGAPSIYMLYLGYDEVAHHSGPWTEDAFGDLKRLDQTFARLRHVAKEKAPRPYDLIVLSDHGQSFGPTFKQRYGISVKELIEQNLPQGTTVAQAIGGDTGANGLASVANELVNVQESEAGTAFDKAVAKQGQKLAERGADAVEEGVAAEETASVTAYGSGNAAQVYFDLYPRKILLSELEAAFPGMVDAVVQHEGIGLVIGYEEDGAPLAIGKNGRRNLKTGEVTGEDPVLPYAREEGPGVATLEKRVWQLKRVMDFPSAGDLWLISSVYPDGTVAALEELIGSHGGVGGEQTDAFILHPADMEVPDTRNATDVFHILNNHRGAAVVEKSQVAEETVSDWSLANLRSGIGQVRTWLNYAIRCIFLDRSAYAAVVRDPQMTGPALLIALVMLTFVAISYEGAMELRQWLAAVGLWLLSVLVLVAAGYLLTKKGHFTKTFRALGFSQSVYVLGVLTVVPLLASPIRLLMLVLGFLATWMGAAVAHETRGWKTLLLPVVAYAVLLIGAVLVNALFTGAEFTVQSVLSSFGIAPPAR
ncbi:MAG: hypothetical protein HC802_09985 [Caldilineaceae bacterium]|nr:hypothetical protein [Caldilineaceae bacterium]